MPWGRTAPGVQKCARRAHFCISAFCPLAPTPFELESPNLAQGWTLIRAIHHNRNFDPPKFRGVKILDFIFLSILNPKAIKMRRPLVQNRNEENGRSPFSEWRFPLVRPCRVSKSKWAGRPGGLFVSVWISGSVSQYVQRLSSIAPDRRSRSGRDQHQKMSQRSGTTMVSVTWRHVSRVTRHVLPREKYAKNF